MKSKQELTAAILKMGLGVVLHELVREGVAEVVKLADKERGPVADAAWFLFSVQQFTPSWLIHEQPKVIKLQAKSLGEAAFKMGLPVSVAQPRIVESFTSTGWRLRLGRGIAIESYDFGMIDSREKMFPKRLETADAAQFLAMDIGVGAYWLKHVGAAHIRVDAEEFRAMVKARQVEVVVTVQNLAEEASGGYIDLKFFKGDVKVGEVHINGKTTSPYQRRVTLSGDYDRYRVESTPSARFSIERVKK